MSNFDEAENILGPLPSAIGFITASLRSSFEEEEVMSTTPEPC